MLVEALNYITPGMDKEISKEFLKILKKQGIKFFILRQKYKYQK